MIDLLVACPMISQNQIAAHFGYTPSWVSRIIRSDGFQERLAARKNELVDPIILQSIEKGFEAMLHQSIEILQLKLETEPSAELALKAADLSARALSYGGKQGNVNVNVGFLVSVPEKAVSTDAWLEGHGPRLVNAD
jgi:hypothetical protein